MAGSNSSHRPHHGGMQFWPRVRAAKQLARVRNWAPSPETKLLGFIGYKAGMTHLFLKDHGQFSNTKGKEIFSAATILECPPMKAFSIRFYKKTPYGQKLVSEMFSQKYDKELKQRTVVGKKAEVPAAFDDARVLVYTQPKLTATGQKVPDVLEVGIGGADAKQKLEYAKGLLDREIKVSELFKPGQMLDMHAVTKGKGFQGTIKRYGVHRRQAKSEKTVRGVGSLGAWHPHRVLYTVGQPGKMGYHQRTEYNKVCLLIGNKPEDINQAGGILNYGNVKGDYVLIKGSVGGPKRRAVVISQPMRAPLKFKILQPEIVYTSRTSKQGL